MTAWTPAWGPPQASQGAGDALGKLEGPSRGGVPSFGGLALWKLSPYKC